MTASGPRRLARAATAIALAGAATAPIEGGAQPAKVGRLARRAATFARSATSALGEVAAPGAAADCEAQPANAERRLARRAAVAFALAGAVATGCEARLVHVFGAHRYDAKRDCLEAAAGVDVVEGEDPGECDAIRCWISPEGEAFVTTKACDAPPDYVERTTDAAGTACEPALAAWARENHGACER